MSYKFSQKISQNFARLINEEIVSNIIKHPFRYYFRVGSVGFGFTLATNFTIGLLNTRPPINPYENPQMFTFLVLSKSLQNGLLWPSIPFSIIKNPKHFFVLGSGISDLCDQK